MKKIKTMGALIESLKSNKVITYDLFETLQRLTDGFDFSLTHLAIVEINNTLFRERSKILQTRKKEYNSELEKIDPELIADVNIFENINESFIKTLNFLDSDNPKFQEQIQRLENNTLIVKDPLELLEPTFSFNLHCAKTILGINQKPNPKEAEDSQNNELINSLDTKNNQLKLIYLKELGIIDHLQRHPPFDMSITKLAQAISAFTGSNAGTIKASLGAMISSDKNDPYNNSNNVELVKMSLATLGFDKNKSKSIS